MNSWRETIALPRPLRDVLPAGSREAAGLTAAVEPPPTDQWQSGFDLGRIEGERSLSEQLLNQRKEVHELSQGILESLRQAVPQVVRAAETTLVSLALEVAQRLVADLPISAPMMEAAIREALAQVEENAQITVRLHSADLELLQTANSTLVQAGESAKEIRFLGSPEVTRGGCLVQTRFGTIDARRETKFDLLKRSLLA